MPISATAPLKYHAACRRSLNDAPIMFGRRAHVRPLTLAQSLH